MKIKDLIIKSYKRVNLRTKIALFMFLVWLISFLAIIYSYGKINQFSVENDIGKVAVQTVNALENNINTVFENIIQFSNIIYFDTNVQNSLARVSKSSVDPEINTVIENSINNMTVFAQYVESVVVLDKYNNCYRGTKLGPMVVHSELIPETNWYKRLLESNGEFIYVYNSEGVVEYDTSIKHNYIMLARAVKDLDTYENLATLMIIINESSLREVILNSIDEYNSRFCIVSSDDYIITPNNYNEELDQYFLSGDYTAGGVGVVSFEGENALFVSKKTGINDWRIMGLMPIEYNIQFSSGTSVLFLMLLLNLAFVLLCSLVISRVIFAPLRNMQNFMRAVEMGSLVTMSVDEECTDEISSLKKVFNQMIGAIKSLLDTTVKEEKIIARTELDLLQAQINPHFLYNTLDAVSALVLLEDKENCLLLTRALGSFYRNMLHSKDRLVMVRDEIECIESYMTIINIRYENKIKMVYEIDNKVKNLKVLKLILQPIVENAIHHGIRNFTDKGVITIKADIINDELVFSVADNGAGIEKKKIDEILTGQNRKKGSGFGLYSSMQRISLYYGIESPISIISEPGRGTEIIIRTKVLGEDETFED